MFKHRDTSKMHDVSFQSVFSNFQNACSSYRERLYVRKLTKIPFLFQMSSTVFVKKVIVYFLKR